MRRARARHRVLHGMARRIRRGARAVGAEHRRRAASTRPAIRRAARCGRCSDSRRSTSGRTRRTAADGAAASQRRRDATTRCCRRRRGARSASRFAGSQTRMSAASSHEARQAPRAAAARRCAIPVARSPLLGKGGAARQDRPPRSAGRPTIELARSSRVTRMPQELIRPTAAAATTSSRGGCASSTGSVRRQRTRARRRPAVRVADRDAGGEAEGRGLVGVRVRIAAVESAVPVRRSAARACCAACTGASACTRWRRAARAKRPGSCSALDRGGACTGVVYRLPAPVAIDELHLLWRREMVVGRVPAEVGGRAVAATAQLVALAFTVRHDHPQYAGKLPIDAAGARHRQCRGRVRLVARLSRAHARGARRARHRRSLSRGAGARVAVLHASVVTRATSGAP